MTICYSAALVVVAILQCAFGEAWDAALITWASTNIGNLGQGRVYTLVASAFVGEGPYEIWLMLPGLVCVLALAELLWGSARLVGVFALGHLGATSLVAGGIALLLRLGWVDGSMAHRPDVGVSYGSMAVFVALVGTLPRWLRPSWAAWWLLVAAIAACWGWDFNSAGHLVAVVLGLGAVGWLAPARERRWPRPRARLLVSGSVFAFLVLLVPVAPGMEITGATALSLGN